MTPASVQNALTSSTSFAIDERLAFIALDAPARSRLRSLKPFLKRVLGPALTAFYDRVRATPQTSQFFPDNQHMVAAKGRQQQHWNVIAEAEFGEAYAHAVRGVGKTHARIGLEPRWYIGGYAIVMEELINALVKERWPKLAYGGQKLGEELAASLACLTKAAFLDMDLSISVYLDELDAKVRSEQELRARHERAQTDAMRALNEALDRMADGDLSARVTGQLSPEFENLKLNFNNAVENLQEAFVRVTISASIIETATNEIGAAAENLSRRTESQAAGLEETSAALAEVTTTIKATATNTQNAREIVAKSKSEAEKGGDVVVKAVDAMEQIQKSSRDIGQIIGVIDEIAFQTNLLALNAGVEAARAGEAGRGFAVVASEVRALAQRSAEAAKEIKELISASGTSVEQGANLVAETGRALKAIVAQVGEVAVVVANIADGAKEQATAVSQVNDAISQMDQATQQNAAMVEETTAATKSLREETDSLARSVAKFKIDQSMARSKAPTKPVGAAAGRTTRFAGSALPKARVSAQRDEWEEF